MSRSKIVIPSVTYTMPKHSAWFFFLGMTQKTSTYFNTSNTFFLLICVTCHLWHFVWLLSCHRRREKMSQRKFMLRTAHYIVLCKKEISVKIMLCNLPLFVKACHHSLLRVTKLQWVEPLIMHYCSAPKKYYVDVFFFYLLFSSPLSTVICYLSVRYNNHDKRNSRKSSFSLVDNNKFFPFYFFSS